MQKGKILVIDDDPGCRESLRLILEALYAVTMAKSGGEALSCLRGKEFDLIILDLNMPGLSGFDVLREIRKMEKKVDVLVITALGSLLNAEEVINYGGVGIISKPFNVTEIITKIAKIIEQRKFKMEVENLID